MGETSSVHDRPSRERRFEAMFRATHPAAAQPAPSQDSPYRYLKTRKITMNGSEAGGQHWSVVDSATNEE